VPAAVIDRASDVTDQEADIVRTALDRLGEGDRRSLWACLETVDNVIASGGAPHRIYNVIALTPYDVRPTVAGVAALRLQRDTVDQRPRDDQRQQTSGAVCLPAE
jgi:hypothetical protein